MKRKRFLRIICSMLLLVACLALVACDLNFGGCKHAHTETETIEPTAVCQPKIKRKSCTDCGDVLEEEKTESTTPCTPVNGFCKYCNTPMEGSGAQLTDDNLPSSLNYGQEQITVLYWSDVENPEFEQETITGDKMRDAIYNRNERVEERLNVKLKWIGVPGNSSDRTSFVKLVDSAYRTHMHSYDIIAAYSRTEGTLAVQGYLQDLSKIDQSYIDLEKPWWPKKMIDQVSVGGSYYFITGDMSTNYHLMMHTVFLNEDMFSQYKLKLPYDDVRGNKWTIDKMIALTAGRHRDADNDDVKSTKDYFGLQSMDYVATSLYTGCGLRYIEQDETAMLKVSDDFTSAKAVSLINKLGVWAATDDVWIHNSDGDSAGASGRQLYQKATQEGRVLMSIQHFTMATKVYTSDNWSFGVVPLPKYDETQQRYYTALGNPYSLYGIFIDFDDRGNKQETLTMLSAVLECWASEAYKRTSPAIFETAFEMKQTVGNDKSDVYDIVCQSVCLDPGQFFGADLSCKSVYPESGEVYWNSASSISDKPAKAFTAGAKWEEVSGTYKTDIEAKLADIVEDFRIYQAQQS